MARALVPLCRRPAARDDTKAERGKELLSTLPRRAARDHPRNIAAHLPGESDPDVRGEWQSPILTTEAQRHRGRMKEETAKTLLCVSVPLW